MKGDSRSHGLWEASAPAPIATPALTAATTADVAVIGAGFTGLSAALHLAQAGARAVVLESMEIGYGGSGRNVGLVNAGMWVMPSALEEAIGPTHGPRLLKLLGDAPALVFDIVRQHGVRELVRDIVTELRDDLPVDLRAFAGDDEAALEAFIDRLLADGSDEILARLTSASAEPA